MSNKSFFMPTFILHFYQKTLSRKNSFCLAVGQTLAENKKEVFYVKLVSNTKNRERKLRSIKNYFDDFILDVSFYSWAYESWFLLIVYCSMPGTNITDSLFTTLFLNALLTIWIKRCLREDFFILDSFNVYNLYY